MKNLKIFENFDPNRDEMIKNIESFLEKFPNNATSWRYATDEIRDLARSAREIYTEIDLDLLYDEEGAPEPLNFKKFKNPSKWNTEGKKYIMEMVSKMSDNALKSFYDGYEHWFEK